MNIYKVNDRSKESGNVLFLILIAVALFAALSYAVTQSTRSGGGSTEREQALLGSSAMTQYPTSLRTSVIRMIIGGVGVENIWFNPPSAFGVLNTGQLVFHPDGGGATYQLAAADVMAGADPSQGTWYFNSEFEIPEIGISDDANGAGADVIAFLPGISNAVCTRINEEFSLDTSTCTTMVQGIPQADVAEAKITTLMDNSYTFADANEDDLDCDGGTAFTAQASGCFYEPDLDQNVYFSVLLER